MTEDKGLTKTGNPELSLEGREAVRSYILKWFLPLGAIVSVAAGVFGYFIRDVAVKDAETRAFSSVQTDIIKMAQEVALAKHKADTAAVAIQASSEEISRTKDKVEKFDAELSSLHSKLDSTMAFQASDPQIKEIADVLARDPRITKVLNDLDKSILTRLQKADQEIEKIKSAYKIDSKPGTIIHGEQVFTFPFPVKHAWVQLQRGIDRFHSLTITAIKDNSVTVSVGLTTSDPRVPDYAREYKRGIPGVAFRVWATSF